MAGVVLNVLPKRIFDFGNYSSGRSRCFAIAERIDISQYIDTVLIVRVHALSIADGTITFSVLPDGFSEEDPGVEFLDDTELFAPVTLTSATPAPTLLVHGGIASGQYASIIIKGLQGTSLAALTATVSLDLWLRSPEDTI